MLSLQSLRSQLRELRPNSLYQHEIVGLACYLIACDGLVDYESLDEYALNILAMKAGKTLTHRVLNQLCDQRIISRVNLSQNKKGRRTHRYKIDETNYKIVPELADLWKRYERENFST